MGGKGIYVVPKTEHVICQFTTEQLDGLIDAIDSMRENDPDFDTDDDIFYRDLRNRVKRYSQRLAKRERESLS